MHTYSKKSLVSFDFVLYAEFCFVLPAEFRLISFVPFVPFDFVLPADLIQGEGRRTSYYIYHTLQSYPTSTTPNHNLLSSIQFPFILFQYLTNALSSYIALHSNIFCVFPTHRIPLPYRDLHPTYSTLPERSPYITHIQHIMSVL